MQLQSRMLVDRVRSVIETGHRPTEVSIGVDGTVFTRAADRAILVSREVSRKLNDIGLDHDAVSVVPQIDGLMAYSVIVHKPRRLVRAD